MGNSVTYKANKIDWKAKGSIQNRIAEASPRGPVVGEGATQMGYTDRHAWFVTYVSEDGRECRIQRAKTKCLDYYAGQYDVQPDPEGDEITLRYRYGKWRYQYVDRWSTSQKPEWAVMRIAFGYASEYEDPHF